MFRFLGLYSKYKFMFYVGEFFYYTINLSALILGWYWIGKKLAEMGYGAIKLRCYVLLCVLISFPVGFASSRAMGMFYHPASQWSLDFFFENMLQGRTHTFHGSLILPIFFYLIYALIFKYKPWHILDTVFLYIPLCHAIGRFSCFIVGCCWGHRISVHLFGLSVAFHNPSPLWALGLNLCIFYFLKQLHSFTYLNPANHRNYKGAITASYLLLYGVDRLLLEIFRTEKVVASGLTQAQITMLIFISTGLGILGYIKYLRKEKTVSACTSMTVSNGKIGRALATFVILNLFALSLYYFYKIYTLVMMLILQKTEISFQDISPAHIIPLIGLSLGICILFYAKNFKKTAAAAGLVPVNCKTETAVVETIKPLIILAGFVTLTLFLMSLFYYLVMKLRILPFPFQKVNNARTAYSLIFTYLPFLVLPVISIFCLRKAQLPILEKFTIKGPPKTILIFTTIGLAASIFYSVDLLVLGEPRLRGAIYWPPVLILSVINAFSEEIAYRLTAYSLILNAGFSRFAAISLQAALYSTVHFFFNPTLGILSLIYGIIMGVLMDRTQSISLCILCHFIVDLGAIGGPILIY